MEMAFVCKQTDVLVVRINNIGKYQWCFSRLLAIFLTLYFTTYLSWPDWLYFYSFFSVLNTLTHLTNNLPVMPFQLVSCSTYHPPLHFVPKVVPAHV